MPDPDVTYATASLPDDQLLEGEEIILIVDDYPDIVFLLQEFLQQHGFPTVTAGSADELRRVFQQTPVAMALLDIGLPDADGTELIPEIKAAHADTSIIMLTAVTDLQTALECLRLGADDYLTKPVRFEPLLETLRKVLEKRRLMINNRRYQKQLEQANFRIQLLHELAMKMNTAYLSITVLDEILQAVLVGITAEEGLKFNRAFLALFDESGQTLEGRLAIGPGCREDAGRIWQEMRSSNLCFHDIIDSIKDHCFQEDSAVNRIARALRVEADDSDHPLIRAVTERKTINVVNGQSDGEVPPELIGLLEEDCFVVVPLYSPSRSLGVIIADQYVTGERIDSELILALESFAGQASLAIEQCRLYTAMEHKIQELETVTHELEKNKDLLVEAERYSAIGHMATQLAHNIRNPITSIGGTARLLVRKTDDPEWLKFLNMMTREAAKVENTVEDLFSFVEQVVPEKEKLPLYPLINKSLMLHYNAMQKQGIKYQLIEPDNEPTVEVDPRLMGQVFVHLIRNAVEAMPDGGQLDITVEFATEQVRIMVRDSGTGIAGSMLERAMDPFYTTKTFGAGIGLALVKRIVSDHDGALEIRKLEKGGTEAVVTLPR
ncbi:MAG: response regulator [Thermodesulfobacteriota bacterium]|nr:response regulator [Thermodesulfobacteriota bacterium]